MVSVLVTGPIGRGFEPDRGNGFLRAIKIYSTPSFGWEVKPEVLCHKISWHVKHLLKSHGDRETKFSFPSSIFLLASEMSLLTGLPHSTGGCQSALVDELGPVNTITPWYTSLSPGDEQKARTGRSSETSVSPHHNQSTYNSIQGHNPDDHNPITFRIRHYDNEPMYMLEIKTISSARYAALISHVEFICNRSDLPISDCKMTYVSGLLSVSLSSSSVLLRFFS
jgi:hypothetical protein